jgi:hypothetical protein
MGLFNVTVCNGALHAPYRRAKDSSAMEFVVSGSVLGEGHNEKGAVRGFLSESVEKDGEVVHCELFESTRECLTKVVAGCVLVLENSGGREPGMCDLDSGYRVDARVVKKLCLNKLRKQRKFLFRGDPAVFYFMVEAALG